MSLHYRQYSEPEAVRWLKLIRIEERSMKITVFEIVTRVVRPPQPIEVKGPNEAVASEICTRKS